MYYNYRNKLRKNILKLYHTEHYSDCIKKIEEAKEISLDLYFSDSNVLYFFVDFLLDCLLELRCLLKLGDRDLLLSKSQIYYKQYVEQLNLQDIKGYSDEHKIIFLLEEDIKLKDELYSKGIPLVNFEHIQQLFIENNGEFNRLMDLQKMDEMDYDQRDLESSKSKRYYYSLLRLRSLILSYFGNYFDSLGLFKLSEDAYLRYIELVENNLGANSLSTSNAYFTLGNYYFTRGRPIKAKICFAQAKDIREKKLGPSHDGVVECAINYCICLIELAKIDQANTELEQLKTLIINEKGKNSPKLLRIYQILSVLNAKSNKLKEATNYMNKARNAISLLGLNGDEKIIKTQEMFDNKLNTELKKSYLEMFVESSKTYEKIRKSAAAKD